MFCQNCGSKNDDGAKFCENCGAPLDAPSADPVTDAQNGGAQQYASGDSGYNYGAPSSGEPQQTYSAPEQSFGSSAGSYSYGAPANGAGTDYAQSPVYSAPAPQKKKLSGGAIAGIVVGAVVLVLVIVGIILTVVLVKKAKDKIQEDIDNWSITDDGDFDFGDFGDDIFDFGDDGEDADDEDDFGDFGDDFFDDGKEDNEPDISIWDRYETDANYVPSADEVELHEDHSVESSVLATIVRTATDDDDDLVTITDLWEDFDEADPAYRYWGYCELDGVGGGWVPMYYMTCDQYYSTEFDISELSARLDGTAWRSDEGDTVSFEQTPDGLFVNITVDATDYRELVTLVEGDVNNIVYIETEDDDYFLDLSQADNGKMLIGSTILYLQSGSVLSGGPDGYTVADLSF